LPHTKLFSYVSIMSTSDDDGLPNRFMLSEDDLNSNSADLANSGQTTDPYDLIPILNRTKLSDNNENTNETTTSKKKKSPVCVIVVGMAGSGKTTLMAQLQRCLMEEKETDDTTNETTKNKTETDASNNKTSTIKPTPTATSGKKIGYCVNLDPATKLVPFGASIDIRDTVDYREVMKQHGLGPNGAIMTCLNLFATKFDQVINILEQRAFGTKPKKSLPSSETVDPPIEEEEAEELVDYILVDTPGQIEAFTWSASGTIMSNCLASSFPTVLAFVVDTPRCAASPNTFMSNMLYACSMLYRTRLPIVIVFNKIDVVPHEFCVDWMTNYESFQEALDENASQAGYYGSLTRSLSLALDEFYKDLTYCGVSAATGEGIMEEGNANAGGNDTGDFWKAVDKAAMEFEDVYVPDLKLRIEEQQAKKRAVARQSLRRFEQDAEGDLNNL